MIACLNLANMLLARATSRRKEIAIRLALGAGRWSIIRQLLIEGMMLSLLGAALGLVLACWATHVLVASLLPRVSMLLSINFTAMPGWRVLAATAGFCVLATLVFGLGPAFKLTRPDVVSDLKEQGGEDRQGKSRGILAPRNLVVLAQVALSLALVTTAGLFIRGAVKAASATPGYSLEGGVVAEVDPSLAGYAEAQGRQLYREIIERLSSVPGAESVSLSSCMPFGMFSFGCSVRNSDGSTPAGTNTTGEVPGVGAMLNIIGTDYFSTMGMPLLRGRKFDRIEVEATGLLQTAIVDEPLARRLWPGQDPLGKRLTIDGKKNGNEVAVLEVVGVVPGLRHSLFDQEPSAHVYVPFGQMYQSQMNINLKLARTGREAEAAFIQDIRRELKAIDPRLPLISLTTLASHRDSGIEMWLVSTGARLFTAFGLLALFLAVVGVYGVKAYLVSRRTREIGIRMALGADIADVLWMVLREGAVLTLVGLGAGLLLASAAGLLVRSMLYQVKALDPLVFCVAPILLAAAIMMACYIPARRAARIQPMSALRSE
jgi:predicted permease